MNHHTLQPAEASGSIISRRSVLGMMGAGAGALLVGCSPDEASKKNSNGVTTLTYWTWLDSGDDSDPRALAQRRMIEGFQRKNRKIRIEEEVVPFDQLHTRLLQAVQAGSGPDVCRQGDVRLGELSAAGVLMPLDDFVAGWPQERRDDYIYDWNDTVFEGSKLAFRQSPRPSNLMYYRTDYFGAAGFNEPPKTQDEFTRAIIGATSGRIRGFGEPLSTADGMARFFQHVIPMFWALGSNLVDPESSEPLFQEEAGVEILEWFQRMVYDEGVLSRGAVTVDGDTLDQQLQAGVIASAFLNTGDWAALSEADNLKGKLAYAPFPNWANSVSQPGHAHVSGWTYVIPRGANAEAAWEFVDYTQSEEVDLMTAQVGGEIPNRKSTLQDEFFTSADGVDIRAWADWIAATPHQALQPRIKAFPLLQEELGRAVQQIIAREADVASELASAAERYAAGLTQ